MKTESGAEVEFTGLKDKMEEMSESCKATSAQGPENSGRACNGWMKAAAISAAVVAVAIAGIATAVVLTSSGSSSDIANLPESAHSNPFGTGEDGVGVGFPVERFEYSEGMGCRDATLYSMSAPSFQVCEQKCALLRRCVSFVFTASKNTCRLFKSSCVEDIAGHDFMMGTGVVTSELKEAGRMVTIMQAEEEEECALGCPEALLGDGSCDKSCDNEQCKFDGGDCPAIEGEEREEEMEDMQIELVSPADPEVCHSGSCLRGWVADGECDDDCNNAACNFDAGDCAKEEDRCSDRCPTAWLNDGACDPECNTEACDFDGDDCQEGSKPSGEGGKPSGTSEDSGAAGGEEVESEVTEDVESDEPSDWCSPKCYTPKMVGDGVCQSECNTEECHFDGEDCGREASEDNIPACAVRGSTHFCSEECPCSHGGGDCDSDAQCAEGLKCKPGTCPNWMSKLTLKDGPQDCCFKPDECHFTCPANSSPKDGKNCVNSFEECRCDEGFHADSDGTCARGEPNVNSEGKSEYSSELDYRSECNGRGKKFCGPWEWWTAECPDECRTTCRRENSERHRSLLVPMYREWPGAWGVRRGLATGNFDQAFLGTGNLEGKFCLAICKSKRYGASCYKYKKFMGQKFCQFLKCEDFRNRGSYIDGCHHEDDYIDLSCKVCKRIWPRCGRD